MNETGKNDPLVTKAYEIAYALSRIAAVLTEPIFAGRISAEAIELISSAIDGDSEVIEAALPGLETIIRFGMDTNMIAMRNGEVILQEINNLKSLLPQEDFQGYGHEAGAHEVDLSDIFSKKRDPDAGFKETKIELSRDESSDEGQAATVENSAGKKPLGFRVVSSSAKEESGKIAIPAIDESGKDSGNGIGNDQQDYVPEIRQSAASRQAAILQKIQQSGNCRLADIQLILPELSERTIRYDLESLVEQGLIERVGVGGRGVYYKVKE